MNATDYTVIEIRRVGATRGVLHGVASRAHVELHATRGALKPADLIKLATDKSKVAVPTMPIKLIRPIAAARAKKVAKRIIAEPPGPTWGVMSVGATTSRHTGRGVRVAVLDSGIDASHPAFAGAKIVQKDFTGGGNGDLSGHGTHCAGTIFGRDVNGTRIGVAPGIARPLVAKVLDDNGHGNTASVINGLYWALSEGANIISMSLGFDFDAMLGTYLAMDIPRAAAVSATLTAYRANLREFDGVMSLIASRADSGHDALVIAATGNESLRPDYTVEASLPAASNGVLSVGAIEAREDGSGSYKMASFSNTNPKVCAPGTRVVSARAGGGLVELSGTSMATPHVAGVAALHWEALGDSASADRVRAQLLATARSDVFGAGSRYTKLDYGAGVVTSPP